MASSSNSQPTPTLALYTEVIDPASGFAPQETSATIRKDPLFSTKSRKATVCMIGSLRYIPPREGDGEEVALIITSSLLPAGTPDYEDFWGDSTTQANAQSARFTQFAGPLASAVTLHRASQVLGRNQKKISNLDLTEDFPPDIQNQIKRVVSAFACSVLTCEELSRKAFTNQTGRSQEHATAYLPKVTVITPKHYQRLVDKSEGKPSTLAFHNTFIPVHAASDQRQQDVLAAFQPGAKLRPTPSLRVCWEHINGDLFELRGLGEGSVKSLHDCIETALDGGPHGPTPSAHVIEGPSSFPIQAGSQAGLYPSSGGNTFGGLESGQSVGPAGFAEAQQLGTFVRQQYAASGQGLAGWRAVHGDSVPGQEGHAVARYPIGTSRDMVAGGTIGGGSSTRVSPGNVESEQGYTGAVSHAEDTGAQELSSDNAEGSVWVIDPTRWSQYHQEGTQQ